MILVLVSSTPPIRTEPLEMTETSKATLLDLKKSNIRLLVAALTCFLSAYDWCQSESLTLLSVSSSEPLLESLRNLEHETCDQRSPAIHDS